MQARADLHVHSTCSDGTFSPAEVLAKAAARGLKTISITDHDTVGAYSAAQAAVPVLAAQLGVQVISGIEISAYDTAVAKEYHILGYGIDTEHPSLNHYVEECRANRSKRAEQIVEKLHALNVPLELEDILRECGGGVIGRVHIATALYKRGFVSSPKQAFTRYLADDRPASAVKWHFSVPAAIDLIHEVGGVAVLAHPARTIHGLHLVNIVRAGLDGIETVHPQHDPYLQRYYEQFARAYHLLTTGGSDFHGSKYSDDTNLGKITIPLSCVEHLQQKLSTHRLPFE